VHQKAFSLISFHGSRLGSRLGDAKGDRVTIKMSPYDLEQGRLIFRHKDERAAAADRSPQHNQFRRR